MSRFAIRYPCFIVGICPFIAVFGVSSLSRIPVDMFPFMIIPAVAVATLFSPARPGTVGH